MLLEGKKIAVVGYGVEGQASVNYYLKHGATVAIFDEKAIDRNQVPEGVKVFDNQTELNIEGHDLVIRTPGLRPDKIKSTAKVSTATNEFLRSCPAPVIGVTGTKGKGTTSTLIYEILKAAGKNAYLVGNIGSPALEILDELKSDDIVVFELSSFQLWDLDKSPHVAVLLMIDEDHMDIHADMEEYIEAKRQIFAHQTREDITIYHPTNQYVAEMIKTARGLTKPFNSNNNCKIDGDKLVIDGKELMPISEVSLLGKHNLENICAAVTAAYIYVQDLSVIAEAVRNFKGLEHRLEYVGEVNGVTYYNDSFASAPAATLVAIEAFDKPLVLIVGGYDKGGSVSTLVDAIVSKNVKQVLIIGTTGPKIASELEAKGYSNFELVEGGMEEIVKRASEVAEGGDVVLLSPGFASFDMFKNFKERGNLFKDNVKKLSNE